jgi:hypothetical protein
MLLGFRALPLSRNNKSTTTSCLALGPGAGLRQKVLETSCVQVVLESFLHRIYLTRIAKRCGIKSVYLRTFPLAGVRHDLVVLIGILKLSQTAVHCLPHGT